MQKLWSIVTALSLLIASATVGSAEGDPPDSHVDPQKHATDCTGVCFPLTATSNVSDSVSVEAVLIPFNVSRRIFGHEIAKNYAIVQLNIGNHNPNATFIAQSVFLDYRDWALSGVNAAEQSENKAYPNHSVQAHNYQSQVGSVGSRLVRSEMLDKQPMTTRNLVIGGMVALGTIGTGFAFPFSTDVVKGIGAWSGAVVPAAQDLFPDRTIRQLNNISDFGFDTNKVVAKQSSEIMVGFFPIQRFLTPTFADIFRKYPAAFFVPREMASDPKLAKKLMVILQQIKPAVATDHDLLQRVLARKCPPTEDPSYKGLDDIKKTQYDSDCQISTILNGVSLNNIRVFVSGDMSVDEQDIPPRVDDVTFDNMVPGKADKFWTTLNTDQPGTIRGEYLTSAEPRLVDDKGKAIDDSLMSIAKVADGSTDSAMKVTINFKVCPTPGQTINIQLTKQAAATDTSETKSAKAVSNPFAIGVVAYSNGPCPVPPVADTSKAAGPTSSAPKGPVPAEKPLAATSAATRLTGTPTTQPPSRL